MDQQETKHFVKSVEETPQPLWYYSEKGVDSIGIVIVDRGGGGDADNLARERRTDMRHPVFSRDSGSVQLPFSSLLYRFKPNRCRRGHHDKTSPHNSHYTNNPG